MPTHSKNEKELKLFIEALSETIESGDHLTVLEILQALLNDMKHHVEQYKLENVSFDEAYEAINSIHVFKDMYCLKRQ